MCFELRCRIFSKRMYQLIRVPCKKTLYFRILWTIDWLWGSEEHPQSSTIKLGTRNVAKGLKIFQKKYFKSWLQKLRKIRLRLLLRMVCGIPSFQIVFWEGNKNHSQLQLKIKKYKYISGKTVKGFLVKIFNHF